MGITNNWTIGEIATLKDKEHSFIVKIIDIFLDEDDMKLYAEVEPIEFDAISRTVEITKLFHEEDL